jgi:hypothetical protein
VLTPCFRKPSVRMSSLRAAELLSSMVYESAYADTQSQETICAATSRCDNRREAVDEANRERTLDPWEGYQQICGIFQRDAHLQMPELRACVRIEGIDPNWWVSVTPELRDAIIQRAEAFLRGAE